MPEVWKSCTFSSQMRLLGETRYILYIHKIFVVDFVDWIDDWKQLKINIQDLLWNSPEERTEVGNAGNLMPGL